ncbi:putative alcohol dehydrogenase [Karstenula rhodostoma CBS 690.94]|uniref:D-xylulose reductase n=1 Tax=Karstenula rhodostoma CBS 690.94 TaxID=1392251 RepID=A0A9P4UGG3_9PLEO|nr:putative alcohol dehydrogenase [Karstenula rhodostoma CBS 690.94]
MTSTTTEINRSFVLRTVKNVAFEDRPVPKLRDEHEVRVHVAQTGICGSDVHYWQRGRIGDFVLNSPIVLGHESSGTVVEAGSKVTNLKVGDRVAIEPGVPCRRCDYCRAGSYNLCNDTIFAATPPWDGTLAKYYTVASDYCYKIPDTMDMEEAALVEPVAVAVQICKVASIRANQTVVVFGAGPIGVLSQAVAKASGAKKIIAVDISQSRLDFARKYAADGTFLPPRAEEGVDSVTHAEKVAKMIKEEFGLGEGADVVLECTGAEPCIQAGVNVAIKGGTYVQAGMGKENVVFPITTACIRALTIKGSIRYSTGCYPDAVHLVASGRVDVKSLITNRFKFEEAEKAFELVKAAKEGVFKVVIEGVQ